MPVFEDEHEAFVRPSPTAKLWRYLDLAKYVSLISSATVWFSRADLLGDPFEGSMSEANGRLRPEVYADSEIPPEAFELFAAARRESLRRTYVSCWHKGEWESAAMW